MIIGLDIDYETNVAEGYLMVEYDGRKHFDRNVVYRVFKYYPDYTDHAGKIVLDVEYSFNELVELYEEEKDTINFFAETDKYLDFQTPTYYDFLDLAHAIDSYIGL